MGKWSGLNWIIGGGAAALLLPLIVFGLGAPFLVAGLASVIAAVGLIVLLDPGQPFAKLNASGAASGRIAFARDLLTEAAPLVGRMEAAGKEIRSRPAAGRALHLAAVAKDILAAIEQDPNRIDAVRRFLIYYLPRSVEIAESYLQLERGIAPDPKRLASAEALLIRLDQAFTRYAANVQNADMERFDRELKLLQSSLDEDLGPSLADAPAKSARGAQGGN
jgi:5-bromo-4-chloroindolyl phosphate hydrolysis protein